jgi:hypothetical protein
MSMPPQLSHRSGKSAGPDSVGASTAELMSMHSSKPASPRTVASSFQAEQTEMAADLLVREILFIILFIRRMN